MLEDGAFWNRVCVYAYELVSETDHTLQKACTITSAMPNAVQNVVSTCGVRVMIDILHLKIMSLRVKQIHVAQ